MFPPRSWFIGQATHPTLKAIPVSSRASARARRPSGSDSLEPHRALLRRWTAEAVSRHRRVRIIAAESDWYWTELGWGKLRFRSARTAVADITGSPVSAVPEILDSRRTRSPSRGCSVIMESTTRRRLAGRCRSPSPRTPLAGGRQPGTRGANRLLQGADPSNGERPSQALGRRDPRRAHAKQLMSDLSELESIVASDIFKRDRTRTGRTLGRRSARIPGLVGSSVEEVGGNTARAALTGLAPCRRRTGLESSAGSCVSARDGRQNDQIDVCALSRRPSQDLGAREDEWAGGPAIRPSDRHCPSEPNQASGNDCLHGDARGAFSGA